MCEKAISGLTTYAELAHTIIKKKLVVNGKISIENINRNQFAVHGYAWLSTYIEALKQILQWAQELEKSGTIGELEILIVKAAFGEYLNQISGGIPISQTEIVRPNDIGIGEAGLNILNSQPIMDLRTNGNTQNTRSSIAKLINSNFYGNIDLNDETLVMFREHTSKFVIEHIKPYAHDWHLHDTLIPIDIINQMSELGIFGLTIPEEWGGLGLGKLSMCVVTEELSKGYIGVGSLGTRSEIAAELIRLGGTQSQKERYLPAISSGEIIPTAVFTEPDTGSDLGSLKTRAELIEKKYIINGNKTWITHGARSDLMTLLVRTNTKEEGYRGLSMFLADKPRSSNPEEPFPAAGMSGSEIEVLGYRGMKEYEIAFDNYEVPADQLLGGREGEGFKQLMETFESARIQTAARSVGLAQNALELGLEYSLNRPQFDRKIFDFPRVSGKLAWMTVETMVARQLTYHAARKKDSGRRCDVEAGMAKLLAARVAWSNADSSLQIHGGNGYSLEYPISRVLCDARIMNIFEGASEIQAQVITRGLLSERN